MIFIREKLSADQIEAEDKKFQAIIAEFVDGKYHMIREFREIILSVVAEKCKAVRKSKYDNRYYLDNIMLVLEKYKTWDTLRTIHMSKPRYHYKTIQDVHLRWSSHNVYQEAYNILLTKHKLTSLNMRNELDIYIDTTSIYNLNGSEQTGYGGESRKKRITKVSMACTADKTIVAACAVNAHSHDSTTVVPTLQVLEKLNLTYNTVNVVGDGGYCTNIANKHILKRDHKAVIMYPHRRNQRIRTPIEHKKKLKTRHVIENSFAPLKKFTKIVTRVDKNIQPYMGFFHLACILTFKN